MKRTTKTTPETTSRRKASQDREQVIAVVIKQYGTGLYRTCVSLDKDNLTFISTHRDERSANETINSFWRAYDEGELKTHEDISRFINKIEPPRATMPPMPPPDSIFTPLAA